VACSATATIDLGLAAALWAEIHTHDRHPLGELLASVPDVVIAGELRDEATVQACRSLVAPSELAWLHRRAFAVLDEPDGDVADRTSPIEMLLRRSHHASRADDHSLSVDVRAALRRAAGTASDRAETSTELRLLDAALETGPGVPERVSLLLTRGDAMRRHGPWRAAVDDYRLADRLAQQIGNPALRAEVGLHLARITWEADLGAETDELLRSVRPALDTTDPALAARVDLCLAGGTYQDGLAGTRRVEPDTIDAALAQAPMMVDPSARAWARIHGRKALLGVLDPAGSLTMAEQIVTDAGNDAATLAHGHQARLVDLLRLDRRTEAAAALRLLRRLPIVSSEQAFSLEATIACLDLAMGRYDGAVHAMEQEQAYRDRLAGDTFDQVTLAHLVWLAIVRCDPAELAALAEAARSTRDAGGRRRTIWIVGGALLDLASDDLTSAAAAIDELAGVEGLTSLADGPHRLPSVAIAAQVAAACRHTEPLDGRLIETALDALDAGPDEGVLVGWPALFLGPTDRFRACAALALGDLDRARAAIGRALQADRLWPAQYASSLRVLAEIEADAGDMDASSTARGRAEEIEYALRRRMP
jgi:tetratricopeptide (TPR) repeat protein